MDWDRVEAVVNHIITRTAGFLLASAAGAGIYFSVVPTLLGSAFVVMGMFMFAPTRVKKSMQVIGELLSKVRT